MSKIILVSKTQKIFVLSKSTWPEKEKERVIDQRYKTGQVKDHLHLWAPFEQIKFLNKQLITIQVKNSSIFS